MNLNRYQKLAVESNAKFLCVLAGPGTGKTHTITAKIIHLLNNGVNAQDIAVLTFTQKSAIEMRQRVLNAIVAGNQMPLIGTFHLLCLKLLREFLPEKRKYFQLCTESKQREIISSLTSRKPENIIETISKFKNKRVPLDENIKPIYEKYEEKKQEMNLFDFDDLLLNTLEMLEKGVMVPLFSNIIVDEFQDINKIQYEIVKMLLKEEGCISIFGDPDQAIYSFRGSEVDLFLNLPKDFEDLTLLNLPVNYRSQANIIFASNKFITANTKRFSKKIEPLKNPTNPITIIEVNNEYEEAKTIVQEIRYRLGAVDFTELYENKEESSYSFSSFAVLARTNNQLELIKQSLDEAGIPVKTVQRDRSSLFKEFVHNLSDCLSDEQNVKKLLKEGNLWRYLEVSGFLESLSEHEISIVRALSNLPHKFTILDQMRYLIDELVGLTSYDLFPEKLNAVSLLTLHTSKGLEFPVVFITGFEEGLIPYTLASDLDMEEERRLFYVGMTRAMDELIITYAKSRFIKGKKLCQGVSSFLKQLPEEYIIKYEKVRPRKDELKQQSLF
ncbi:ATP-dependent helicase [Thermodesulfovibrio thiophilus]|uniref:ATP-dependent helicase n=1 Tax=Thermodesulfovibrio thiophilus TaxID=340095 RepID=UPI0017A9F724|nr:ATP-dependent helicase [Thermodesulfovibrio thiophilus]HHW20661.1 ATP-dependent helicase [Thermodesulfovibrio thiophilus]